jgi:hypothetical protein
MGRLKIIKATYFDSNKKHLKGTDVTEEFSALVRNDNIIYTGKYNDIFSDEFRNARKRLRVELEFNEERHRPLFYNEDQPINLLEDLGLPKKRKGFLNNWLVQLLIGGLILFILTTLSVSYKWPALLYKEDAGIKGQGGPIIVNQPRELYSSTQSVVWPGQDFNNSNLDLDGFGRIYIWIDPKPTPYSISMATNVVPRIFPESHIPGLGEIKKVFIKAEEESKKYNFDTSQNQVKEFYIGEKKFVVRLIEIKNIVFEDPTTGVKSETSAYEYVFQIREIE